MGRFLVLAPVESDDESLFAELGQMAAPEPSHFHVLVPLPPGGGDAGDRAAARHLDDVVAGVAARGLDADGEVGEISVLGSVARAVERDRYDAIVVPVPGVGVRDTIDLEVAHRLHQIDARIVIVTPGRRRPARRPRWRR